MVLLFLIGAVSCTGESEATDDRLFSAPTVNGTTIAIDKEASAVLAALGQELSYEESPSCAFEGMDKLYVYSGFRVKTYSQKGIDYIYSVEILDDSLSTPEGLFIGDGEARVTELYGSPSEQNDAGMQYCSENTVLQILLRDGVVTNIQYLKLEK